jgi:calcineurin-like phosphoesterase family protein
MRYFIADTHFGHEKLVMLLPRRYPSGMAFETVAQHDHCILSAINDTVGPKDELFILGDFGFKPGKYRMQINCRNVTLILGNHDPPGKCRNVFGECPLIKVTKARHELGVLPVVLCHYPMAFWSASHHGSAHLYGHTHGKHEGWLEHAFPGRRAVDVGVDNLLLLRGSYKPVSEEWVYEYMMARPSHDPIYKERDRANRD